MFGYGNICTLSASINTMSYVYPYAEDRPLSFVQIIEYTTAYAEQVARDTEKLKTMRVLLETPMETPMENRKRPRVTYGQCNNDRLHVIKAQAALEQSN